MARNSYELNSISRQSQTGDETPSVQQQPMDDSSLAEISTGLHESSLPPVDGGKDAWFFLAACFALEALTWGFPFAYGVFQDYYSTHEPFAGSSQIAVIGTCAMGIMYLDAPIVMGLLRMYPRMGRWSPFAGLAIMCSAIAASSFSQTTTHLIITQGVFFAIGGSISYCPCIVYMDEWFVKRKGLAYGIMWSGTGLAGFALPLVLQFLLDKYGFRTTLRVWAITLFILIVPLIFFIKPRLPYSAASHPSPFKLGFMRSRVFLLHQTANIAQALGFFLPGIYLPSYARSELGASTLTAALTVLLINVASVFGCVAMGHLVDKLHVTTCIMISTVGTTIGTFLLWGMATNLPVLYVYCVIYGLFAGSYTSAWPGIMRQVTTASPSRNDGSATAPAGSSFDPIMVFGLLAAGRGVGNVLSGPLSAALLKGMPWKGQAAGGYGSGYGTLIAFTGVTALAGGASFLWRRLGWL